FGQTVSYEHDPWDRISSIEVSGGSRISYERDVLGRIVTVHDGQGLTFFQYSARDAQGRTITGADSNSTPSEHEVVRHLPNGIKSTFILNEEGHLILIRHETANGARIAEYRYTRGSNGRIVALEEDSSFEAGHTQYSSDELGRLISVQTP